PRSSHPAYHLGEDGVGVPDPEVLGSGYTEDVRLGDSGEARSGLVRAEEVVELGYQHGDRLAVARPYRQLPRTDGTQGWREQDQPAYRGVGTVPQGQLGTEGPAEQPDVG